jgi:hypothetical protein
VTRLASLLLAAALVTLPAACGGSGGAGEAGRAPAEMEGRIVGVREEEGQVRSFVVEADGERYELAIDPAVDYGFDLAHLHEHEEASDPVRCRVEDRDGVLYALEIRDA